MPKKAAKAQAPTLTERLAKAPKRQPLWKGPTVDGITFSLLNKFLGCRERFRLYVVEGLRPSEEKFNSRMQYGNMWHVCEEAQAARRDWRNDLKAYVAALVREYKLQQAEVLKWYRVCALQFPIYVDYWKKHPDEKGRTPAVQEWKFNICYTLPSGRFVRLRGKWDAVDVIKEKIRTKTHGFLYLQENKSKSEIDVEGLSRQLQFDLQTMLYLTALQVGQDNEGSSDTWPFDPDLMVGGIRYNVIRRPLSGGKGNIRPLKEKVTKTKTTPAETDDQYFARLEAYLKADLDTWFARWKVGVGRIDIEHFRNRCLNPILEDLCDWWEWIEQDPFNPWEQRFEPTPEARGMIPIYNSVHYQYPFGTYNPLTEQGHSEYDHYLNTGNKAGLTHVDTLFKELQ